MKDVSKLKKLNAILRKKWFFDWDWTSQTDEEKELNRIIQDLMGFPLQILDFILDWFYLGIKKFPMCLTICDAFNGGPCALFKVKDPGVFMDSLCITYDSLNDAFDLLEEHDLIIHRRDINDENGNSTTSSRLYFNLEKITKLLLPAQTEVSNIFVEILNACIKACDKVKSVRENSEDKDVKKLFSLFYPDREYFYKNFISLKSYE